MIALHICRLVFFRETNTINYNAKQCWMQLPWISHLRFPVTAYSCERDMRVVMQPPLVSYPKNIIYTPRRLHARFGRRAAAKINFCLKYCSVSIFYCTTWDIGVAHKVIMFSLPLITNKKFLWKMLSWQYIFVMVWCCFFSPFRSSVSLVTMVSDLQHYPCHSWTGQRKALKQKTRRDRKSDFLSIFLCFVSFLAQQNSFAISFGLLVASTSNAVVGREVWMWTFKWKSYLPQVP